MLDPFFFSLIFSEGISLRLSSLTKHLREMVKGVVIYFVHGFKGFSSQLSQVVASRLHEAGHPSQRVWLAELFIS